MARVGGHIATTTRCPLCGAVVPVTIHIDPPRDTVRNGRPLLVAVVRGIDALDYELHLLGCPGSPPGV